MTFSPSASADSRVPSWASQWLALEYVWLSLPFSAPACLVRVFSNALPKRCACEELLRFQPARARFLLPPQRQSGVEHAGRRKLGKLAELLREVKNLFLQIDHFSGGQPRHFHTAFCDLKLPA